MGWIGEVDSKIVQSLKGKGRYVGAEIDFGKVRRISAEEYMYMSPSKYPAVTRDIALLVPRYQHVESVMNKIHAVGGPLIRDIDLFDMYEGGELEEGLKNIAFHITFQSDDRTLTSEEVDDAMKKIAWQLAQEEGWEAR